MGNEAYRPGDWHLVRGMKRPPVPYKWERAAGMGRTYSRVPTDGVTRAGEGHDAPMGTWLLVAAHGQVSGAGDGKPTDANLIVHAGRRGERHD